MKVDIYEQINQAVVETIEAINDQSATRGLLKLAGVYDQADFDTDAVNLDYPGIVVFQMNLADEPLAGDTEANWRSFPVGVVVLDRELIKSPEEKNEFLRWRKVIEDTFHQMPTQANGEKLTGVPEVSDCRVRGGKIFDLGQLGLRQFKQSWQMIRSSLVLNFLAVEPVR